MLKEYGKTGASAYLFLKKIRISMSEDMRKSVDQLSPGVVITLMFKWLAEREGKAVMLQLRMHDATRSVMH